MSVTDRALNIGVIAALILVGYLLVRPGQGPAAVAYSNWRERRQIHSTIRDHWNDIASIGPVLGARHGTRPPAESIEAVVFFDYECPFCLRLEKELTALDAGGQLPRIVLRHFPLPNHPAAKDAALAAVCADRQGQFAQMHRYLTSDRWGGARDFQLIAAGGGITDTSEFRACVTATSTDSLLNVDKAIGQRLHISGTPAVITRKLRIDGFIAGDSLLRVLANK